MGLSRGEGHFHRHPRARLPTFRAHDAYPHSLPSARSPGKPLPYPPHRRCLVSQVHLIGGEKGGVGKSVVARVVAQYLIDRQIPFVGFDTDRSHGSLLRFYGDYASPVVVDRYESLDAIIEAATADPSRRVLVDLAAQTHEPLVKWMDESGVLEMVGELGISLHYWHVMDSGKDSVDLLTRLLDRFEARLNYVIVLNQVRGDRFDILEASGQLERARQLNARILPLRKLHEAVITKIDARHKSETDVKGLGLLERQRVKVWLQNAYAQLDALEI